MRFWKKLIAKQIAERIFQALDQSINYRERTALGVPASRLDQKVFYDNPSLLQNAPFLRTLLQNPNHIGCHTLGDSEPFFAGTQHLERELISICAEDILKGEPDAQDGYIAAGGTEANIQAVWIYRNYFMREKGADISEIGILCSEDSHYSMFKAGNLLNLKNYPIKVNFDNRQINKSHLSATIQKAQKDGIRYFIVVANMMTTMFGSVDEVSDYVEILEQEKIAFKLHVDGAFGGFIYPFSAPQLSLNFNNPHVTSVTLDAHKLVEAPYGTGIFLIRKGWIKYACTEEAQYVNGLDVTLSGSRSGANAVAVWMILMTYGPNGWFEKIHILNYRTKWLCEQLDELNIEYFRQSGSNIVAIKSEYISEALAHQFGLVPDIHIGKANWYKIVVMDHVTVDELDKFITAVREMLEKKNVKGFEKLIG
ncbi:MAG: pyridoxal-dependent decarboxylase [Bacteroidetes bacterium]|nr:pyridoxal-dependent decarboxylase [Bacteroidota bacterium]